jgi:phage terminase large subunit-like protein
MSASWPPRWLTHDVPEWSERAKVAKQFVDVFGTITKESVAGRAGSRMVLRDWQNDLIRNIYAVDEDGGFLRKLCLVGMPRKNGKSALASHLAVFDTFLGVQGGETYSVAVTRDQARIVFSEAKRVVEMHEDLRKIAKLYRDAIEVPSRNSVYRVLSAEAGAAEGLNASSIWFDELHAQPNRKMFDVMSLSMAARGNKAHMVAITTAGVRADSSGRDSVCFDLYQMGQRVARGEVDDPSFWMAWWEAPEELDHKDPETWKLSNPGFGDLNSVEDFESAVRRTPEAEFRTKRTNFWASSQTSWLPTGAWDECAGDAEISYEDDIILGFDGSFSGDASVIVAATIPKDGEPVKVNLVKAWEKDLTIHDDNWRVDIAEVEQAILDYCQSHPNVKEVACDPFRWQRSMEVLMEKGVPIVEYPSTSARRMVPACAKFYDAVMEKRIVHDGDGLLARHLSNAVTKIDQLGVRIVKDQRNSPRKIDAAVAAVIATDRALTGRMEEIVPQFFG